MTERIHSFDALVDRNARILILGSMPGLASLAQMHYYAHPRNAFWPIMASLLGFAADADYRERCRALLAGGVALWDVMASCRRRGSLDAAIDDTSIVTNDIAGLLRGHPAIRAVFFNGSKAEQCFRRHVAPALDPRSAALPRQRLPSTSPAHAGLSREAKREIWQTLLSQALATLPDEALAAGPRQPSRAG
ncbi:MAG: DNA-deoxyinosine glycosylase [Rhodocyclaceae bacterium]|nr:DNA-deoxyinosine glycosylase [Rhodocyclaceae bacterium]